jgi:hypothetical protein
MDFVSVATAAVSLLSPFLPRLIALGGELGGKIKDAVVDTGATELGKQAKNVWDKITGSFGDDRKLTNAAAMTADAPDDTNRQKILIEELAKRLKDQPELAEELVVLMGGEKRLQQLIAGYEAIIEDISFEMKGAGEQTLKTGDKARIKGVKFDMK